MDLLHAMCDSHRSPDSITDGDAFRLAFTKTYCVPLRVDAHVGAIGVSNRRSIGSAYHAGTDSIAEHKPDVLATDYNTVTRPNDQTANEYANDRARNIQSNSRSNNRLSNAQTNPIANAQPTDGSANRRTNELIPNGRAVGSVNHPCAHIGPIHPAFNSANAGPVDAHTNDAANVNANGAHWCAHPSYANSSAVRCSFTRPDTMRV